MISYQSNNTTFFLTSTETLGSLIKILSAFFEKPLTSNNTLIYGRLFLSRRHLPAKLRVFSRLLTDKLKVIPPLLGGSTLNIKNDSSSDPSFISILYTVFRLTTADFLRFVKHCLLNSLNSEESAVLMGSFCPVGWIDSAIAGLPYRVYHSKISHQSQKWPTPPVFYLPSPVSGILQHMRPVVAIYRAKGGFHKRLDHGSLWVKQGQSSLFALNDIEDTDRISALYGSLAEARCNSMFQNRKFDNTKFIGGQRPSLTFFFWCLRLVRNKLWYQPDTHQLRPFGLHTLVLVKARNVCAAISPISSKIKMHEWARRRPIVRRLWALIETFFRTS